MVARRSVGRVGDFALKDDPVGAHARIRNRDGRQQSLGIGMFRRSEQFLGGRGLHNPADARIDIMVEFHSLWNLPAAKKIARALEAYAPMWYEDPIRMNSPQALAEYARSTDVWVCASETLGSRWPFKDFLEKDALHVAMVDLCWTGGLTEGRKIASLAETWHRPFAPHDCIGPVGFIAAVHMSFSQPNTLIQESVRAFYRGWYNELVTVLPRIENGYVYPMEGPGLGVELQPAVFKRQDLTVRRTPAG